MTGQIIEEQEKESDKIPVHPPAVVIIEKDVRDFTAAISGESE